MRRPPAGVRRAAARAAGALAVALALAPRAGAQVAPDGEWRKTNWWMNPETRALTVRELEKLGYVTLTGRYN